VDGLGEGAEPALGCGPARRRRLGQAGFGDVAEEDDGAVLTRPPELATERRQRRRERLGRAVGRVAEEAHLVGDVGGGGLGRRLPVALRDVGAGGGAAAEGEGDADREEEGEEARGHGGTSEKRRRVAAPPPPSLARKRVPSGRNASASGWP